VEATLVQHPAVLEAAVIGVPDAEGLTKTKAFVVLKPGAEATADELKAFVKDKLAPYKYPRQIEFVADLPKTATGKIQRFKLRDIDWQGRPVRIERWTRRTATSPTRSRPSSSSA
jgi:benzoate-CoA ligase